MVAIQQTKDKFIAKAVRKYGELHDYSLVEYRGFKIPVSITCKEHSHTFSITPWAYLSTTGCPMCGAHARRFKQASNTADFIEKATSVHGDRYDYSKVVYENNLSIITIGCSKHGEFQQKAAAHLLGKGCRQCAFDKVSGLKRKSAADFIAHAREFHGDTYDYSEVVYVNNATKVKIKCRVHGVFEQAPAYHTTRSGCPNCAVTGYRTDKAGYFYILTCGDITKIGITNVSPQRRATDISRSYGSEFSILDSWRFEDGSIPLAIEQRLLKELRSNYPQPAANFEGSSESFLNVDRDLLVGMIRS
jgi:Zn finger protein HypA/HybF involved in hydrogenase expression